jgi:menaquinol-cytochrome c reductase iron-sulfur subunit
MDRRAMMKWAIRGIGLATTFMVGIPSLIVAFAPVVRHRARKSVWQSLGQIEDFPVGEMRKVILDVPRDDWGEAVREKAVYAWRPAEGEAVVYSRNCTDLGCPLTYDPGSECFFCPCHGGIFSKNGDRMAGPPKRPMYRYAARFTNGEIEIDLNSVPPMA